MESSTTQVFSIDSFLFNLDPRTKIVLIITISTVMISGGSGGYMNYVRPLLVIVSMLMLLSIKKYKAFIKFGLIFIALFCAELLILPKTTGILNFVLGAITGIYNHMLPGIIVGYYTMFSTRVSEFIAAMERMNIPRELTIPTSVIFRLFPTMREEYQAINDAMRIRGITISNGILKTIEYRVVPFIISVAKVGEELSAAALTRGMDNPTKRTNICSIGFSTMDFIFIITSILCWIIYFYERIIL